MWWTVVKFWLLEGAPLIWANISRRRNCHSTLLLVSVLHEDGRDLETGRLVIDSSLGGRLRVDGIRWNSTQLAVSWERVCKSGLTGRTCSFCRGSEMISLSGWMRERTNDAG